MLLACPTHHASDPPGERQAPEESADAPVSTVRRCTDGSPYDDKESCDDQRSFASNAIADESDKDLAENCTFLAVNNGFEIKTSLFTNKERIGHSCGYVGCVIFRIQLLEDDLES